MSLTDLFPGEIISSETLVGSNRLESSYANRVIMAARREAYFTGESGSIFDCLYEDLSRYVNGKDLSRMRLITLDDFVPGFLKKIMDVHNNPVHFEYDKKKSLETKERFGDLINKELHFRRFVSRNNRRTKLHGTNLVYVRYNNRFDEIYLQYLHEGNCWVLPYPDYVKKPAIVMYRRRVANDHYAYYVWNEVRKEHYWVKSDVTPGFKDDEIDLDIRPEDKLPIEGNDSIESPNYFPFVAYRYDDELNTFWCNGMDSLIEYSRTINTLLTITGDDVVQETMKLLLLNFNPLTEGGTKDSSSGMLQTGMAHPFYPEDSGNQAPNVGDRKGLDAKIVQGELYTKEVLSFIDGITQMICSLNNVENIVGESDMRRVSGEALKVKHQFLEKDWREDADLLEKFDKQLIEKIIQVNDVHRRQNKIGTDFLKNTSISYEKPVMPETELEKIQRAELGWKYGQDNPIKFYAKQNSVDEDQAKEEVESNLEVTRNLIGRLTTLGMPNTMGEQVDENI